MSIEDKEVLFEEIKRNIEELLSQKLPLEEILKGITHLLASKVDYYDWVGFYLTDPEKKSELVLGPFVGEPTEHVRIPFGKGICGQAAETKLTFIVQDVSKENNYLSCSPKVKSEIVTPILDQKGNVLGELDIDSHVISPFTNEDKELLEWICNRIAKLF